MPQVKPRSTTRDHIRDTVVITFANKLLPDEYREIIGDVESTADELIERMQYGDTGGNVHFLEHLDFYREADTHQNSTKEFRLPWKTDYQFKFKYWFSNGSISLQYDTDETKQIKIKGNGFEFLFTGEYQQELMRNGHPSLPKGFHDIKDICPLFQFEPDKKDRRMVSFEYCQPYHTGESLKTVVAQTIILWDLITLGTPPKKN